MAKIKITSKSKAVGLIRTDKARQQNFDVAIECLTWAEDLANDAKKNSDQLSSATRNGYWMACEDIAHTISEKIKHFRAEQPGSNKELTDALNELANFLGVDLKTKKD